MFNDDKEPQQVSVHIVKNGPENCIPVHLTYTEDKYLTRPSFLKKRDKNSAGGSPTKFSSKRKGDSSGKSPKKPRTENTLSSPSK